MMANRERCSFENFLITRPSLTELTEHVVLGTKWHRVGVMLELNKKDLDGIRREQMGDCKQCTVEMFDLWLNTKRHASRDKILKVLESRTIGEQTFASEYNKSLKEDCK